MLKFSTAGLRTPGWHERNLLIPMGAKSGQRVRRVIMKIAKPCSFTTSFSIWCLT